MELERAKIARKIGLRHKKSESPRTGWFFNLSVNLSVKKRYRLSLPIIPRKPNYHGRACDIMFALEHLSTKNISHYGYFAIKTLP